MSNLCESKSVGEGVEGLGTWLDWLSSQIYLWYSSTDVVLDKGYCFQSMHLYDFLLFSHLIYLSLYSGRRTSVFFYLDFLLLSITYNRACKGWVDSAINKPNSKVRCAITFYAKNELNARKLKNVALRKPGQNQFYGSCFWEQSQISIIEVITKAKKNFSRIIYAIARPTMIL